MSENQKNQSQQARSKKGQKQQTRSQKEGQKQQARSQKEGQKQQTRSQQARNQNGQNQNGQNQQGQEQKGQCVLQRIYVKALSFDSPGSPQMFGVQWHPEVRLSINTTEVALKEDLYEVVLSLTTTVTNDAESAFTMKMDQAGVFLIRNLDGGKLDYTLGAFCPSVLYPYAREAVDNMVNHGSFPPLMLAPVNFDMLYNKSRQEEKGQKVETVPA